MQLLANWGLQRGDLLEARPYETAQHNLVRVGMQFTELWQEMRHYTGGDGYLDKPCMELVGLPFQPVSATHS